MAGEEHHEAYRGDLTSAHARIEALTRENEALREEMARASAARPLFWTRRRIALGLLCFVSAAFAVEAFFFDVPTAAEQRTITKDAAYLYRAAAVYFQHGLHRNECPTLLDLKGSRLLGDDATDRDAWGGAFHVECKKDDVVVTSRGPDGIWDTFDDIRAPTPIRIPPVPPRGEVK